MPFSFPSAVARHALSLLIALGISMGAFARERGPRVEVFCPSPPVPVRLDKRLVLVYELHVTNFDIVPLTLKHFDVFANEQSGAPLISLTGDKLAAAVVRVGSGMGESKDTQVIEPGRRSVIFVWIELQSDQPLLADLHHKLVFSRTADGGTSDTTLEDFQVAVGRESVPMLTPPFKGGTWFAGDGPANDSPHRRTITAIDGHIYSAERFAIDWIKVGPNGDSHHDGTAQNENWWGYGEPVLAVADGEITEVLDGIPDNTPRNLPPVTLENIAGNCVILQIAPRRYVTYAHLQNGSIKVRLHEHVHRGALLALLGNSGNTTGAHLHLQVTTGNSVLQSEGVPFVLPRFTYLGLGSVYEADKHISVPWANSIPPGNGVIEFEPEKE